MSLGSIIPVFDVFINENQNSLFILQIKRFEYINKDNIYYFLSFFIITLFILKGLISIFIKWYQSLVSHITMNLLSRYYISNLFNLNLDSFNLKKI